MRETKRSSSILLRQHTPTPEFVAASVIPTATKTTTTSVAATKPTVAPSVRRNPTIAPSTNVTTIATALPKHSRHHIGEDDPQQELLLIKKETCCAPSKSRPSPSLNSRTWGKKYTSVATCSKCGRCRKVSPITGWCSYCTTKSRNTEKVDRRRRYGTGRDQASLPIHLVSEAAYRTQMLALFLETHNFRDPSGSYLQSLPVIQLTPMMSEAVTTLCLAWLGRVRHDDVLAHASQRAYGNVLSLLHSAVNPASRHHYRPSEVILSILIMRLYTNDEVHGQNHMVHSIGAARYMEACGPDCLDPADPLSRQLMKEIHLQTLIPAIAMRQSVIWHKPGWEGFERGDCLDGRAEWWPSWISALSLLPALLEETDQLLARPASPTRTTALADLITRYQDFHTHASRWSHPATATAPELVSVLDQSRFDPSVPPHAFLLAHPLFPLSHVFTDYGLAFRCTVSWICLLVADCSLLRILYADPVVLANLRTTSPDVIEARAVRVADLLCQSVYSYTRRPVLPVLLWLRAALEIVAAFYDAAGRDERAVWARGCGDALDEQLAAVRATARPTLCRVEEVAAPLSAAVRFRPGSYRLGRPF